MIARLKRLGAFALGLYIGFAAGQIVGAFIGVFVGQALLP